MTSAVAIQNDGADRVLEVLVSGNLAALTPADRLQYFERVCDSLKLNPLTKPFEFLTLNNKLVLYATKACTDQLRQIHGVSIEVAPQHQGDLYIVTATATDATGRRDSDVGVVTIKNLSGDNLSNAIMKATTKAKRRVTLSICGLGMLDETEIADIPASAKRPAVVMPQSRIAPPNIDISTGEIVDDEPDSPIQPAPAAAPSNPTTSQQQPASGAIVDAFKAKLGEQGFTVESALSFSGWEAIEGHSRDELNNLLRGLKATRPQATPS